MLLILSGISFPIRNLQNFTQVTQKCRLRTWLWILSQNQSSVRQVFIGKTKFFGLKDNYEKLLVDFRNISNHHHNFTVFLFTLGLLFFTHVFPVYVPVFLIQSYISELFLLTCKLCQDLIYNSPGQLVSFQHII